MPLTILLHGARGRMGHAVTAAAAEQGVLIGAAVDVGDDPAAGIRTCEVIVDFSAPAATAGLLRLARDHRKPIVIGTTGHDAAELPGLRAAAAEVPCVWTGNFSVGMNVLFHLTQQAAHALDAGYDAEIVEMHHRFKRDAPSGTAARLLEIIRQERQLPAATVRHGRHGLTGERPPAEIGVHSLRGGDVVGDHTVIFAALGERLELTHRASDRAILARGALRAAEWIRTQPPGVYDMQDVLGLKRGAR
jgi:4-hydroxy-tetrahydrodipicolinate reductase